MLLASLMLLGPLLAAPAPASADPYNTYQYCHREYKTTSFAYYYAPGGYSVYAHDWEDYNAGVQSAAVLPDPCHDVNVEIASTGGFVVRTVICPYSGAPCYALAWGSLNQFTTYGVTAPQHQLPCGGVCAFMFRVETTTAETFRLAW